MCMMLYFCGAFWFLHLGTGRKTEFQGGHFGIQLHRVQPNFFVESPDAADFVLLGLCGASSLYFSPTLLFSLNTGFLWLLQSKSLCLMSLWWSSLIPLPQYSQSQFSRRENLIGQPWIRGPSLVGPSSWCWVLGIPVFGAEQILQVQAGVGEKVIS